MRRIATQETTDADNRVVLFRLSQGASRDRNFERARNANKNDILFRSTRAEQSVVSALVKTLGDERVEARYDNRKPPPRRAKATLKCGDWRPGGTFKFYFCFRFSLRNSASQRSIGLLSLKLRRSLFQKRRRPFFLIFGRAADGKQSSLEK